MMHRSEKNNNISPKNSDTETVVDINHKYMLDKNGNNNNDDDDNSKNNDAKEFLRNLNILPSTIIQEHEKTKNDWLGWLDEAIKNDYINFYNYNNSQHSPSIWKPPCFLLRNTHISSSNRTVHFN